MDDQISLFDNDGFINQLLSFPELDIPGIDSSDCVVSNVGQKRKHDDVGPPASQLADILDFDKIRSMTSMRRLVLMQAGNILAPIGPRNPTVGYMLFKKIESDTVQRNRRYSKRQRRDDRFGLPLATTTDYQLNDEQLDFLVYYDMSNHIIDERF
jgi:hypothetical protein